jgi:hypothetical protein
MVMRVYCLSVPRMPLRWLQHYDDLRCQKKQKGAAVIDSECFYDLSQNPQERPSWTVSGSLPTLRRNSLLWHAQSRRFLTPQELAACFGIASFPPCAETAHVSVDPCRHMYSTGLLGNTMHVAAVGCVMMSALAAVRPVSL